MSAFILSIGFGVKGVHCSCPNTPWEIHKEVLQWQPDLRTPGNRPAFF